MNFLFDPYNATNIERTPEEMELFAVFCMCVAGKTAVVIAQAVNSFFSGSGESGTPFEQIIKMHNKGTLRDNLIRARTGKYNYLSRGLYELATSQMDLYSCDPQDLEKITGIGMKTSRFFILHSRKNTNIAIIDTHILKYLKAKEYPNIPNTVPSGKNYLRLEHYMLEEAKNKHMSMQDLDLKIWSWYANKKTGIPDDNYLYNGLTIIC